MTKTTNGLRHHGHGAELLHSLADENIVTPTSSLQPSEVAAEKDDDELLLSPRRAESYNSLHEYAALSDDNDSDDSQKTTKCEQPATRRRFSFASKTPTTTKENYSLKNNKPETLGDLPTNRRVTAAIQHEEFEEPAFHTVIIIYFAYMVLELFGHLRTTFERFGIYRSRHKKVERNREGYAPLFDSWEAFYTEHMYRRIRDCWNRPICSCPGAETLCLERVTNDYCWTFQHTGRLLNIINMGSYNYLGFAQPVGPCAEQAHAAIEQDSVTICSPRNEVGTTKLHLELERLVADFLGVEDAVTFGMGYATNSCNIPALLMHKNCLILSDELNHASLVMGCKLSGASVRVYKHNNVKDLEHKLRQAIVQGHPRTHRPWQNILILVEGVYSMEGSIVRLSEIVALKKKYKAYLYLDEAHSIGAVGPHGRGVCDLLGVDPRDIDILMGTFTKSFGSAGGYLAGSRQLCEYIRRQSHAMSYACSMQPPVAQQIISSMRIIMGRDCPGEGRRRIERLAENTKFLRRELRRLGFVIYGNDFSPVVPLMIFLPAKLAAVSRELLKRGVAAVSVGFPATALHGGRLRFCLSAAHTREMLEHVVAAVDEVGTLLGVKYSQQHRHHALQDNNKTTADMTTTTNVQ